MILVHIFYFLNCRCLFKITLNICRGFQLTRPVKTLNSLGRQYVCTVYAIFFYLPNKDIFFQIINRPELLHLYEVRHSLKNKITLYAHYKQNN